MSSTSSSYELVLTSSPDGPIVAYDASTGAAVARFPGTRSPRGGLTVAGNCFIAGCHVSPHTAAVSIHLYNWHTWSVLHRFSVPEFVAPLAATADGGYLFAGGQSGSIHCFSVPSGDVVKSFPAHAKPISCLQLSNDGSLVISGSDDGSITVIPTFQLVESSDSNPKDLILHHFNAHSDSITAFSTGLGLLCNSILVSSSLDSTCKFWNLLEGTHLRTMTFPCPINGVAISNSTSDSHYFFAAGSDGSVYKGSTKKAQELVRKWNQSHVGPIVSVVLVNEGRNLVSAGEDGSVWMWKVGTEEVIMEIGNNNAGSISDMIVARGTSEYRGKSNSDGEGDDENNNRFSSSWMLNNNEEVMRSMKKIMEVGDVLSVVEEDKKKAIKMLESAIAMYERLLELILEEALKGSADDSDEEEDEEDEKDDK
ncbi:protein ROOT INITIATION DEFECTIVE 3-like [Prosopis cineraria]|uniref:protein ROOT INITIATION DEFECTIVE 3-like n=1 Tax=Prosopis cineraria TaxID=364024 RepID=UPI00240ED525|nr:protein ROOT INITIATION DEFECTIVE 3-like [Prosopis cineraria]